MFCIRRLPSFDLPLVSPGADLCVERDGDVVFFAEGDDAVDEAGEF